MKTKLKALNGNALIEKGKFYNVLICQDQDGILIFRVIINEKTCRYFDMDYRTLCFYFEGLEIEEPEPDDRYEYIYIG